MLQRCFISLLKSHGRVGGISFVIFMAYMCSMDHNVAWEYKVIAMGWQGKKIENMATLQKWWRLADLEVFQISYILWNDTIHQLCLIHGFQGGVDYNVAWEQHVAVICCQDQRVSKSIKNCHHIEMTLHGCCGGGPNHFSNPMEGWGASTLALLWLLWRAWSVILSESTCCFHGLPRSNKQQKLP